MRFLKKFTILVMLLSFSITFLSCYDYRETSDMAIITGMAIDKTKENKYLLTIEYAKVASNEGNTESIGEIASIEGDTIFDAARNAIGKVGKKLYWGHAKVVIINKNIAESGISPIIDWINRDSEMRSEMFFLIAKNCEAREVFTSPSNKNLIMSNVISKIVLNQKNLSKSEYNKDLVWIYQYMSRKEVALTTPTIYLDYSSNKVAPVVSGSAVFNGDKLVGYLDGEETKTMLLLRGSLKGGLIILQNINNTGSDASLEIFSNVTKHEVYYDSGRITLKFFISPNVNIGELTGNIDYIDLKRQPELKKFADEKIENDVKVLIDKIQKNNYGDIIDFSEMIKAKLPKVWRSVENDWQDTFKSLHIVVESDVKIKGSARTSKPIKLGG